ncbi:MAG: hypothetical protein COS97_02850 [Candidatus Nealsonbacteria bacterium CG07_land_8_20_14_0_80_40_10]|nr:MAG: hypothetical protein COU44_01135 [Candidatus Nealsonbacteria bacterium CG10_big_fil_rev_8_21_14_0_10_40_24]PIU43113.1 MAG: hypothetical protein COS97_02850 [Candidatus Nealsonbacteria bacterium CG07_land_8_20_14_0_80_40_10]
MENENKPSSNNNKNTFTLILLVLVGLLVALTSYFYAKSTTVSKPDASSGLKESSQSSATQEKTTTQPLSTTPTNETKPISDVKTHPSSPAILYQVEQGKTLFQIGAQYNIDWLLVASANGLNEPYKILAGQNLIIPTYDNTSKTLKIDFKIDDETAKKMQQDASDGKTTQRLDPVYTSQVDIAGSFGLSKSDSYVLKLKDEQKGEAQVIGSSESKNYQLNLYQPQSLGPTGIWAIKEIFPVK